MSRSNFKFILTGALASVWLAAATPAASLTINLIDIGGVTGSSAQTGFQIAARYWESVLINDATVNLNVGYSNLGPNVLGGTRSSLAQFVPISDYYSLLAGSGTTALDAQALANLSPLNSAGGVSVIVPGNLSPGSGIDPFSTRMAPDDAINSTIALSTANLRALGIDLGGFVDGQIEFSSTFGFDFNPTNGIGTGQYDFIGVAVHEIGHALGFISGVDDFDFAAGFPGVVDDVWWGYGLDMFRYSASGQLDWSVGTGSYFSIDGGQTPLYDSYFSTGSDFGNGWQASHWRPPGQPTPCDHFRGIMNPYICDGRGAAVTGLDLALFDAIGWNLNFDVLADNNRYRVTSADMYTSFRAAVPEPATWAMLILGFGLIGVCVRARQPRPAT